MQEAYYQTSKKCEEVKVINEKPLRSEAVRCGGFARVTLTPRSFESDH